MSENENTNSLSLLIRSTAQDSTPILLSNDKRKPNPKANTIAHPLLIETQSHSHHNKNKNKNKHRDKHQHSTRIIPNKSRMFSCILQLIHIGIINDYVLLPMLSILITIYLADHGSRNVIGLDHICECVDTLYTCSCTHYNEQSFMNVSIWLMAWIPENLFCLLCVWAIMLTVCTKDTFGSLWYFAVDIKISRFVYLTFQLCRLANVGCAIAMLILFPSTHCNCRSEGGTVHMKFNWNAYIVPLHLLLYLNIVFNSYFLIIPLILAYCVNKRLQLQHNMDVLRWHYVRVTPH